MAASKSERLTAFLNRLEEALPARSVEEALELVNKVLDAVEDELSEIPYDPDAAQQLVTDGRMYGPHPSFASDWKNNPEVTRFAHARHDTFIQSNGAVLIRLRRPRKVLLSKAGADGREVTL